MFILIVMLVAFFGLLSVCSPRSGWYLSYGWRYKDAEPGDAALLMQRLGGVFVLVVAVVGFIFALHQ